MICLEFNGNGISLLSFALLNKIKVSNIRITGCDLVYSKFIKIAQVTDVNVSNVMIQNSSKLYNF